MRKLILPIAAVAALTLSACGGDEGASGDQGEVADQLIEAAEAEGLALDRGCVEDLAGELSDEDAAAILAAGPDGDPQLSAEGDAVGDRLFSCVDTSAFADLIVTQLEDSGLDVDADCVRDALSGFDPNSLAGAAEGDLPDEMLNAMFDCVDLTSGG